MKQLGIKQAKVIVQYYFKFGSNIFFVLIVVLLDSFSHQIDQKLAE